MKAVQGIIAYTVENGSHHTGKNFNTYRSIRQRWNSQRRFSA